MKYKGRVLIVFIFIFIVVTWHSFYFLVDFESSYVFLIEAGHYKWDFLFIPLLSPFFWWLGYQYDKAKFLSEKDALTGLYNRRYVAQVTPKLLEQTMKTNKKMSISIIDCNNFKKINDTYGHKTGDTILVNIARILQESTSKKDVVARWGGDEFIIVSSHLKEKNRLSHIEASLKKLSIQVGFDVSVSIGTAIYPDQANNIDQLLKISDRTMYNQKLGKIIN
ncbi:response regulator [Halalkalibacter wakoensis JCM 9140]|uniref:Response regulator n=1 Tax=Halalkalibacter wakoensis JCM 9140 TaxID=1236970 RepID=W4Q4N7_9BACI|nr:GGDEF domain-containing protein [Halalkalibacter wakoensis]GAE27046.1 response regulator [Halalkalibacter wakoensis JCM 9140]